MPARAWGFKSPLRHERSHTSGRAQTYFGQLDFERGSAARHDSQVVGVDVHGVDQVLDEHTSFSVVGLVPHGGDVDRGEQLGHFLEAFGQLGAFSVTLCSLGVGGLEFGQLGGEPAFFVGEGVGGDLVGVVEVEELGSLVLERCDGPAGVD
ncbi:MAG: hypothetical protein ACK5O2_07655 [Microthrixaceae bacterium]